MTEKTGKMSGKPDVPNISDFIKEGGIGFGIWVARNLELDPNCTDEEVVDFFMKKWGPFYIDEVIESYFEERERMESEE